MHRARAHTMDNARAATANNSEKITNYRTRIMVSCTNYDGNKNNNIVGGYDNDDDEYSDKERR